jgi:hypothetical protein
VTSHVVQSLTLRKSHDWHDLSMMVILVKLH